MRKTFVVAVAAFEDLRVERCVFLVGVHAHQRHILVERVHGQLEGGEMRVEQDDFFARRERVVEIMLVAVAHQLFQTACIAVPIQAVFGHQYAHLFEMCFEHRFAFVCIPFGKAFFQIDASDAAARRGQPIGGQPQRGTRFLD